MEDKTAFITFSIDASTNTGNVVELWMFSAQKYILGTLSIKPVTLATELMLAYSLSNATTPQTRSGPCIFAKNVKYNLKIRIEQVLTVWTVKGELLNNANVVVCALSLVPAGFNAKSFFANPFTYVLSQSSTGTNLQRSIKGSESMSITVNKMGVECTKGDCSSKAPHTATTSSSVMQNQGFQIELIAGIIAVAGGIIVVVLLLTIIIGVVVIKRRKKQRHQVSVYETHEVVEEETNDSQDNPQILLDKYNAFGDFSNDE
jgi:hypothetical protein